MRVRSSLKTTAARGTESISSSWWGWPTESQARRRQPLRSFPPQRHDAEEQAGWKACHVRRASLTCLPVVPCVWHARAFAPPASPPPLGSHARELSCMPPMHQHEAGRSRCSTSSTVLKGRPCSLRRLLRWLPTAQSALAIIKNEPVLQSLQLPPQATPLPATREPHSRARSSLAQPLPADHPEPRAPNRQPSNPPLL